MENCLPRFLFVMETKISLFLKYMFTFSVSQSVTNFRESTTYTDSVPTRILSLTTAISSHFRSVRRIRLIHIMMTSSASIDTFTLLGELYQRGYAVHWRPQSLANENRVKSGWSGETVKNVLSAHKFKEQIMNCLTGATKIEIGRDGFCNAQRQAERAKQTEA